MGRGTVRVLGWMCGLVGLVLVPVVGSAPAGAGSSGPPGGDPGHGGRVNGWGVVDVHDLPDELGYDMFTVIRLAPGGDMVLGTGDRLADTPPATRIPQYFTSDGDNSSSEPTHFVARTTLFSLGRATRFGAAVDDITCAFGPPPCAVLDVVTHFAYDGGELEVHSEVSLVPDPQRPGYGLVGARPDHDTITRSSGVFVGRTWRGPVSRSRRPPPFPGAAPL